MICVSAFVLHCIYLVKHDDSIFSQVLQLLSQFTITFSVFVCNLE